MIKDFFLEYFENDFDKKKVGVLESGVGKGTVLPWLKYIQIESEIYFKEGVFGGYSSCYCVGAWNEEKLKNEADLTLFELLFEIDVENGADTTKILHTICLVGAFEAVKVRKN